MKEKGYQSLTEEEIKEAEALEIRLAELNAKRGNVKQTKPKPEKKIVTDEKIQQDSYITVMSLVPHGLNLTTEEFGQGKIKKFTRFGETKRILYKDLLDMTDAHANFFEAGYVYIMNSNFVRQNGLEDIYETLLTKENILKIISTDSEECVTMFSKANPKQQEIIARMIIDKMRENPDSVNLNIVDKISRISKIKISEIVQGNTQEEETE